MSIGLPVIVLALVVIAVVVYGLAYIAGKGANRSSLADSVKRRPSAYWSGGGSASRSRRRSRSATRRRESVNGMGEPVDLGLESDDVVPRLGVDSGVLVVVVVPCPGHYEPPPRLRRSPAL